MNLLKTISNIQDIIFSYDIYDINKQMSILIEEIGGLLYNMETKRFKQLNEILEYVNIALLNKDYLLIADILQYELRPFIEKISGYTEEGIVNGNI